MLYLTAWNVFVVKTFPTPNLDTLEVNWGQSTFLEIDKDLQLTSSSEFRSTISSCNGENGRNEGTDSLSSKQQQQFLPTLQLVMILWLSPLAMQWATAVYQLPQGM